MASIVGRQASGAGLGWSAARHLLAGLLALAAAAGLAERHLDGAAPSLAQGAAVYLLFAAAMAALLYRHGAPPAFGGANRITLVRLVLVSLLAGYVGRDQAAAVAWPLLGVSLFALLLDGVDGWWARRRGLSSAFGARFDMETDALLILVLSLLVWHLDKAGPWVILSGALRYLFVAAGWMLPFLDRPLPHSERRRVVCVVQVAVLVAGLAPVLGPALAAPLAAAGLALTAWSFAVDIRWLVQHRNNGDIAA